MQVLSGFFLKKFPVPVAVGGESTIVEIRTPLSLVYACPSPPSRLPMSALDRSTHPLHFRDCRYPLPKGSPPVSSKIWVWNPVVLGWLYC